MNWEHITQTLGEMAILVAAAAWLAKALIKTLLAKDLEKFKSDLQIEAQRRNVEFTSLHEKRAALISELYNKIMLLERGIMRLSMEMGRREYRLEKYIAEQAVNPEPWRLQKGIHTLSESEELKTKQLQQLSIEFDEFYTKQRIYFSEETCSIIDSFSNITGAMALIYEDIAIREDDGSLMVNPIVVDYWNNWGEKIPSLKIMLEREFRIILGVLNGRA